MTWALASTDKRARRKDYYEQYYMSDMCKTERDLIDRLGVDDDRYREYKTVKKCIRQNLGSEVVIRYIYLDYDSTRDDLVRMMDSPQADEFIDALLDKDIIEEGDGGEYEIAIDDEIAWRAAQEAP